MERCEYLAQCRSDPKSNMNVFGTPSPPMEAWKGGRGSVEEACRLLPWGEGGYIENIKSKDIKNSC